MPGPTGWLCEKPVGAPETGSTQESTHMASRIVIADDHPLVLEGLAALINSDPAFEIVATVGNGDDALAAISRLEPELAVVDLRMPGQDGLSVIREIARAGLQTRTVLLAAAASDAEIYDCLAAGAGALVFKEAAGPDLLDCLHATVAGSSWKLDDSVDKAARREAVRRERWQSLSATLTPRELEIIRRLQQGEASKIIAFGLGLSEGTVKVHLNNIFRKLQVGSRSELMSLSRGLVPPDPGHAKVSLW